MKHAAKLRPNFLYAVSLVAAMVCFLAVATDISSETIAAMASALIGVVGTVCKELVQGDEPQTDEPETAPAADDTVEQA